MINPVFANGKINGVLVTDFDIDDLSTSFYTPKRPVLWSFLTMYLQDKNSEEVIQFHTPKYSSFPIIHYHENITRYYTLNVSLDFQYFVLNKLWLLAATASGE